MAKYSYKDALGIKHYTDDLSEAVSKGPGYNFGLFECIACNTFCFFIYALMVYSYIEYSTFIISHLVLSVIFLVAFKFVCKQSFTLGVVITLIMFIVIGSICLYC